MPDRMPENMPDAMSDRMPEDMPEDLPDRMPEDMPEHMPEDMPDRMPKDMSDRMPEDLPVRKCIHVMVGITRSKVIFGEPKRHNTIQLLVAGILSLRCPITVGGIPNVSRFRFTIADVCRSSLSENWIFPRSIGLDEQRLSWATYDWNDGEHVSERKLSQNSRTFQVGECNSARWVNHKISGTKS